MTCHHQFIEIATIDRPKMGVVAICAECGQVRELYKDGKVVIKVLTGQVEIADI